jgi:hypothetical protein
MAYKMLTPSESAGMKDLFRLHGADKSYGEAVSSQSQKYLPSKEEIKKIAWHIEKIMKVKVSDALINGEEGTKVILVQDLEKLLDGRVNQRLERFARYPLVVEQLKQEETKGFEPVKHAPSYFDPSDGAVYMITDNFEKIYREKCEEKMIDANSAEGKRFEGFLKALYFTHEEIHKTIAEKSPAIRNSSSDRWAELAKVLEKHLDDENKTPEKEEKVVKSIESIRDKYDALDTCMEGIAHYAGHKVMCKLGYPSWASTEFGNIRNYTGTEPETPAYKEVMDASKGIKFVEAIQIRTHENPIALIIEHPPTSMKYINNPGEYLKDREEGKT